VHDHVTESLCRVSSVSRWDELSASYSVHVTLNILRLFTQLRCTSQRRRSKRVDCSSNNFGVAFILMSSAFSIHFYSRKGWGARMEVGAVEKIVKEDR
jgi:hypothetical protein